MKTELKELIKYYGSQKATAKALGITDRHVRGILAGTNPCGNSLRILIERTLKDIKIKELME